MLFTKKFFLLEGRCGNQLLKETKEPVSSQVRQHDKSPHTDTGPDGCGSLRGQAAAPGSVLGGETGWQGSACVPSRGPSRPGGTGDDSREPLGDDAAVRSRNCHWPGAATPSPLSNGPAPRACASAPSPRRRPPPSPGDDRAAAGQGRQTLTKPSGTQHKRVTAGLTDTAGGSGKVRWGQTAWHRNETLQRGGGSR